PFNQMMDFPVTLSLRSTDQGPRLFAWPVQEIESLYTSTQEMAEIALAAEAQAVSAVDSELLDLSLIINPGDAKEIVLTVHGLHIGYDVAKQELHCNNKVAPLAIVNGEIELRLLVDRASIEIFGNHGRMYMPMAHVNESEDRTVALSATGGAAVVRRVSAHALKSIWGK
ncbi:MAG: GH32 C-terminal domain-containing protein, partial [Candidatus Hydrogenedentes bacterium]|nr:GH32 C-terminal domain-containing protein [Candidatus Hydrogenedentota bacterium]